ncbi:MAG: hypothetical protein A3J76_03245 [Candidatus Moranbacteria bacterium RBG_13_45_13]|nr:MAG: hypothetical protein A3J76_03245 [Candidatus Moranbacteria bacterium RBG_13_45_13]
MLNQKPKTKNQKYKSHGSALIFIVIIATIGATIIVGLVTFIVAQDKASRRVAAREQAFQMAEAGIYWYRWYLAHTVEGRPVQEKREFWESGTAYGVDAPYEAEVNDPEGGAQGKYKLEVTPPGVDSTVVIVKATGWTYKMPNVQRIVQVRFRQPAWCEYAVVADDFMRFGSGTEVFGMIHSNKGIRFDGLAHNVISSLVPEYDDPDHSGDPEFGVHTHVSPVDPLPPNAVPDRPDVFAAGRTFPAPDKNFNALISNLDLMRDEAVAEGLYLGATNTTVQQCSWVRRRIGGRWQWVWECQDVDVPVRGYHIVLKTSPAHSMDVSMVTEYNSSSYEITSETASVSYPIPDNGIVFVENFTWVEGTLDGDHLTIAAADLSPNPVLKDIYINHDILYTDKVGDDADGPDILGLIAQNNVSVGLYSDDNLEIDAALLAQKGKVGRNYYSWPLSPVDYVHRDIITVYGSIVTKQRYGFAYTDGTGYHDRILNFDNNLVYWPPPFFPTGDKYQIDLWEEL